MPNVIVASPWDDQALLEEHQASVSGSTEARDAVSGERKYFLSNAPGETPKAPLAWLSAASRLRLR